MSLKRGFFGSLKSLECDRCGKVAKPSYIWKALCVECYAILPSTLREENFKDSRWEAYTKKSIKYVQCSICGKKGNPESFMNVCVRCRTDHPDSTHGTSWGYAPSSDVEVEHCDQCGGIVIKRKTDTGSTLRTYYKVGQKESITHPYRCTGISEELRNSQSVCEHAFLKVYSNAKSTQESAGIESDLRSQPIAMQIMASDMAGLHHNLAYASEGSTHFWCRKCGYYLNLNPSRYGLLPKHGKHTPD